MFYCLKNDNGIFSYKYNLIDEMFNKDNKFFLFKWIYLFKTVKLNGALRKVRLAALIDQSVL